MAFYERTVFVELVIITGLSGAGKSQAIKALEDFGYYCVDNLPPVLIQQFIALCEENMEDIRKMAVVTDIRGGIFFKNLIDEMEKLKSLGIHYKILFLDASDEVLVKRFKESRRAHPVDPTGSIEKAIEKERKTLETLKNEADFIVDTTSYTLGQFKNKMSKIFSDPNNGTALTVSILSFGFKKGLPKDADFVFDVRFLPNPFYVKELRPKTGNETVVQDYVMSFSESQLLFNKVVDTLSFVIPLCQAEGRTQLIVAIGCTGGRHRSVTLANKIGEILKDKSYKVEIFHRDVSE